MGKAQKRVRVIGDSWDVTRMFRGRKGYAPMVNDTHSKPDLVVFTGGSDIEPSLYNENPLEGTRYDSFRDKKEIAIYDQYKNVPKVGICRGGQLLNVLSGGALWQDVNNHNGSDHVLINLLTISDERLAGDEFLVTSTHHQMMIPSNKGEVLGIALDRGYVKGLATEYNSYIKRDIPKFDTEVVWYDHTSSLCFQPHPEYMGARYTENYFFDLLDYFFK